MEENLILEIEFIERSTNQDPDIFHKIFKISNSEYIYKGKIYSAGLHEEEITFLNFNDAFDKILANCAKFHTFLPSFELIYIDKSLVKFYTKTLIQQLNEHCYSRLSEIVNDTFEKNLNIKLKKIKNASKKNIREIFIFQNNYVVYYNVGSLDILNNLYIIKNKKNEIVRTFPTTNYSTQVNNINHNVFWYFKNDIN